MISSARYEVRYLSGGAVPTALDACNTIGVAKSLMAFIARQSVNFFPRIWDREQKRYLFDKELA